MTWSANSEAGDAHLRSVFISSSLYHPSVMVSSTSCFLETKIFSWFTNASYTCVWQAVWSKVFKDPNMWAFITKNWKTNVLCMSILLEIGLAEQIRQSIAVSFGPFTFDNIGGFTVNSFSLWPHPTHQSCFCSIAQKHLEWDPNR